MGNFPLQWTPQYGPSDCWNFATITTSFGGQGIKLFTDRK